jgi:hypothetical protein
MIYFGSANHKKNKKINWSKKQNGEQKKNGHQA